MQVLATIPKGVYGLTGTPMANSPEEVFGIAKVINPSRLPTKYITKWRRLTMDQVAPHVWEPRHDATILCHKVLQPAIMHRTEDCIDLPDISFIYKEFKMTEEQDKVYKDMVNHQIAEYNNGVIVASTAAVKYTKLLQISNGCVYDADGEVIVLPIKDKVEEIIRIQRQVGQVIVCCQFVHVIKELQKKLKSCKIMYGGISMKDRGTTLKEFKEGKFDILIIQPRVGSHGLNIQYCNALVFFGPILGNSFYRQMVGRIRRSGQLRKQLVFNFFSSRTDKQLYKMLETREVNSQDLLDLYTL